MRRLGENQVAVFPVFLFLSVSLRAASAVSGLRARSASVVSELACETLAAAPVPSLVLGRSASRCAREREHTKSSGHPQLLSFIGSHRSWVVVWPPELRSSAPVHCSDAGSVEPLHTRTRAD